jgi:hypothetical protein
LTRFAENRLLRWLGEPRVDAALGAEGRAALERLCDRLPEVDLAHLTFLLAASGHA